MKKILKVSVSLLASMAIVLITAMIISILPCPLVAKAPGTVDSEDFTLKQTDKVGVCSGGLWLYASGLKEYLQNATPVALIPGLNQNFVPQGMDMGSNGYLYISGYFKNKDANPFTDDANPSAIVVLDSSGTLVGEYPLYHPSGKAFTSHLGGIAVTEDKVLFSASKSTDDAGNPIYRIGAVDLSAFTPGTHALVVDTNYSVPVQPSYLNYSQGTLWVGNFYLSDDDSYPAPESLGTVNGCGAYLFGYDLREGLSRLECQEGCLYPMPDTDKVFALPESVQGMTMLSDGRIVLSCSYGRLNRSSISIFDPQDSAEAQIKLNGTQLICRVLSEPERTITAPPMAEGITANADDTILILYESGAVSFDGYTPLGIYSGIYRTDWIWKLDTLSQEE